jgi:hypothetical protein
MHNNGNLGISRPRKLSYTISEAAVRWARMEGAKSANDPRIGQYNDYILQALNRGDLKALTSDSSFISADALKEWAAKYYPKASQAFA